MDTNFPEILMKIRHGEKIGILHGNTKVPVAMLVPYMKEKKIKSTKSIKGFSTEDKNLDLLSEKDFFYSVSEHLLTKDWLNKEEDEAWKSL